MDPLDDIATELGCLEDAVDRLALAVLIAGRPGADALEADLRARIAKQQPRQVPPAIAALEALAARSRKAGAG